MSECKVPPPGWKCTRPAGHEGPCAAWPVSHELIGSEYRPDPNGNLITFGCWVLFVVALVLMFVGGLIRRSVPGWF